MESGNALRRRYRNERNAYPRDSPSPRIGSCCHTGSYSHVRDFISTLLVGIETIDVGSYERVS